MPAEPLFSYNTLLAFLFAFARISGVFALLPLAAFRAALPAAKIVLALALTVILWPEWKAPAEAQATLGGMVACLAGEAALGLTMGLAVAIVIEAFQAAAQIVSLQAGFGHAAMIDPASGAESTVLLTAAQLMAALFFFVSGADRMLIRALADSLRWAPPGSFTLHPEWATAMAKLSASIFGTGLRLAAPVIALLLLADFSLAVLGRIQTQLHLISLTMPVKLAGAMLILAATMAAQARAFESLMTSGLRLIEGILRSAH